MKKYILILILMLLVLTGCGKSYDASCSNSFKEPDENGKDVGYSVKISFNYKDNKITESVAVIKFDKTEDADLMCSFMKIATTDSTNKSKTTCKGKTITVNEYHLLDTSGTTTTTKDTFVNSLEEDGFKCK